MSEDEKRSGCYPDDPWCLKKAHDLVTAFESEVDSIAEEDGIHIDDDLLDVLESEGESLRDAVEAAIGDAYYWGAAVAFGLMGMAEAIRHMQCREGSCITSASVPCYRWRPGSVHADKPIDF